MGGFASILSGLGKMAGEAFSGKGESITGALRDSEIGNMVQDTFRSQRSEFLRGTPQGSRLLSMFDQYTQLKNQALGPMMAPLKGISDSLKNDPEMLRKPLQDIHSHLQSIKSPAAQHSAALMADPANASQSLLDIHGKMRKVAALQAQAQIFGPKSENIASILMPLYESADATMHSHANAMLDILANQFHDTIGFRGSPVSSTKMNMRNALELENKTRMGAGQAPMNFDPRDLKTGAVYQGRNALENLTARRARLFLAPLIAIPHISTFFNLSWAPLTAIGRTLGDMDNQQIGQLVEASGIYNTLLHHMLDEDIRNSSGIIGRNLKPEYGRLAGNLFHNPGFNLLRKAQLHTSGILGYHSAMFWGEEAARGDRRALAELKDLGLDAMAIARRGGQLTQEEKIKAIFQFTNNRMFVDRTMDRSLTATRNPWTRMLTMFHGYTTNQQAFMRHELSKMVEAGDYAGVARVAGTFGVVFPTIAPLIHSLEVLGRTASPQQAMQTGETDYKHLTQPKDTGQFVSEYIDMLSFFGTWGTLHSFFQSAHNDRLALYMMGPIAGSATRTAQDAINFAFNPSKSGGHNIRPLAEDVLQQTVPIAGSVASRRIFPPRQPKEDE